MVVGDGCKNAKASATTRQANFFTGFTGVNYGSRRPAWNVAGVDYPVGTYASLVDPNGAMPSCVTGPGPRFQVTAPCTLKNFDFSLHGGYCFDVSGNGDVLFDNVKWSNGFNNCSAWWGFIKTSGPVNVTLQNSEIDGNYGINGGVISVNGSGTVTLQYNALIGIDARVENAFQDASGSVINRYNFMNGFGCGTGPSSCNTRAGDQTGVHAEVLIWESDNPLNTYNELWNTYYQKSTDGDQTAFLYIQTGIKAAPTITQANANYNTLVSRTSKQNGSSIAIGGNPPATPIKQLSISNNWIDFTGNYVWLLKYAATLYTIKCSSNYSLTTGVKQTTVTGGGLSCN